jgi:hypothetical protein
MTENTTETTTNVGRPIDVEAHRRALVQEITIVRSLESKLSAVPCEFACQIEGAMKLAARMQRHLQLALWHRAVITANRF